MAIMVVGSQIANLVYLRNELYIRLIRELTREELRKARMRIRTVLLCGRGMWRQDSVELVRSCMCWLGRVDRSIAFDCLKVISQVL